MSLSTLNWNSMCNTMGISMLSPAIFGVSPSTLNNRNESEFSDLVFHQCKRDAWRRVFFLILFVSVCEWVCVGHLFLSVLVFRCCVASVK